MYFSRSNESVHYHVLDRPNNTVIFQVNVHSVVSIRDTLGIQRVAVIQPAHSRNSQARH